MKKTVFIFSITLLLFSITGFITPVKKAVVDEQLQWYTFQQAVELNKKNPKKLFIDVFTSWCGWCKVMDANTFTDPVIIKDLNKYYYAVKLNAEMNDSILFNNHLFVNPTPEKGRSVHQLAAALLNNQMSYPTVVFLDEGFNMLSPVPGYQKPEGLEPILIFYGENHYKTTKWEDFSKNFKGEAK